LAPSIIIDTDFLSSFVKIERVEMIREFYRVSVASITGAVLRELSAAGLDRSIVGLPWISFRSVDANACDELQRRALPTRLGQGELESIVLAQSTENSVLLISDSAARSVARREGVTCVDIPTFLLGCKMTDFLTREQIDEIIEELHLRDRYSFRQEVRSLLLA